MTAPFLPRRRRAGFGGRCLLAGWAPLMLACGSMMAADAVSGGEPADARPLVFNIERLPLRLALEQYLDTTGLSLLYDNAITTGRQAGPLRGVFTPDAALRTLLAGTGIVARQTAPGAFMLLDAGSMSAAARSAEDFAQRGRMAPTPAIAYFAVLQETIGQALCGDPLTAPGGYRLAARVWVGPDGAIQRILLHPTGDAVRDRRIEARLRGLRIPVRAPAGVSQPITLLILPRPPAHSGDCGLAHVRPSGRVAAA
ncbi:STN domain-containing protein [Pseudothauera rhizosphaerae]|uniref:Secretin/TonB short N-terminal domain-containing protein n=1 Tax=Pseudothauera rhizosphaerae TaxID=2565932 RepID=A0A4S4AI92_9RHOO|nr:STN domain-containing protein [Pseudothauera rhizosphaerae]THF58671.1 hypothetical protein E6O51_16920 [Pseudothauera rhizosphaerae]